ncbi:hypothetical protein K438DRAFT_1979935 [Mycena galopus ATCC 62051]|nr:hypothetical protein K438DRAFT_1979935 [Mycena galopus ATCC 62051]
MEWKWETAPRRAQGDTSIHLCIGPCFLEAPPKSQTLPTVNLRIPKAPSTHCAHNSRKNERSTEFREQIPTNSKSQNRGELLAPTPLANHPHPRPPRPLPVQPTSHFHTNAGRGKLLAPTTPVNHSPRPPRALSGQSTSRFPQSSPDDYNSQNYSPNSLHSTPLVDVAIYSAAITAPTQPY